MVWISKFKDSIEKLILRIKKIPLNFWSFLLIFIFVISYILLVINHYWQFGYWYIDNVYFDRALWNLSQGKAPIVWHQHWGFINIFSDHFHPTIMLFSLIYRIFPFQEAILIACVLVYSLGAFFGIFIGRHLNINFFVLNALIISYFMYLGTQNAFLSGFHEIVMLGPWLLGTVWAWLTKRRVSYFIFLALLLLTKETMAFIVTGMVIFMLLYHPQSWRLGLITLSIAVIYYLAATKIIIPAFGASYRYNYTDWPNNLSDWIYQLTYPVDKIRTVVVSFASFGFLPLFFPPSWPMIAIDFLTRFLGSITGNVQYTLDYHYGWGTAPILFLGSLFSYHCLEKRFIAIKKDGPLMALIIVTLVILLHRYALPSRGPLEMVIRPAFYQSTQNNRFLWDLISHVPENSKEIMTMNHLAYPMNHKAEFVSLLCNDNPARHIRFEMFDPEYIVYDLRSGQNPNNFFPNDFSDTVNFVSKLIITGKYKIYWQEGHFYILKKS